MKTLRLALFLALCSPMGPVVTGAATPALVGIQQFGGALDDTDASAAMDGNGNVLVVASFSGTVDFGGGPLVSAGGQDVVLMSFTATGEHRWSQRFGGTAHDVPVGVAVDAAGNVIITGRFTGPVSFGGANLGNSSDIFLAKYDTYGVHQWSQSIGLSLVANDAARHIAVDPSGNVFVSVLWSDVSGITGCNPSSPTSVNFRVTKYDPSGVFQWNVCPPFFGNPEFTFAVDLSGNLFLTGSFVSNTTLAGQLLVSAGGFDVFLAKYSPSGAGLWARRFGTSGFEVARGIALDESGDVLVTGMFSGTVDFGAGALVSAGMNDIFLCKFDTDAVLEWSNRFGGTSQETTLGVVAANDNAVLVGNFSGAASFGGDVMVSPGSSDTAVARYGNNGSHVWSHAWGRAPNSTLGVTALAPDNAGGVMIAASFTGNAMLDGISLHSAGLFDFLNVRYAAEPAEPFITSVEDIGNDQGRMVKVRFEKSGYDNVGSRSPIRQYDVLRRDDPPPSTGAQEAASASGVLADGWTQVGTISAYGEATYGADVPTIGDSTIVQGPYNSVFSVRAATDDPVVFFPSPNASGYSLDNLAPGVPQNFTYSAGHLTWDKPTDTDFDYFTVYGNNTNAFASATLINYTVAPDHDATASPYAYYFATATDFSGNEGKPATVKVPSGVDGTPSSYVLSVSAYPNPFNPQTTIRCTLPARARVILAVYDARGTRVKSLMNEDRPAGTFTARWDGRNDAGRIVSSGVYFARLQSGGENRSYKLVLQK